MRFIRTEVWGYAILLVVLFSICTIAVWHTLNFIGESVADPDQFAIITILVWSITLGFMLIAGAFGMWAIEFSAVAEGRRRISRMVNSMDYIKDGLIVCNDQGHITGANPAAKRTFKVDEESSLSKTFPALTTEDIDKLLASQDPYELERELMIGHQASVMRFRSQPTEGMSLILISDVTTSNTERGRARHTARLQFIGQISKGVANEFNNLLCGISGYASLYKRLPKNSPEIDHAMDEIIKNADRGVAVAGQLLQLAKPIATGTATEALSFHVEKAIDILGNTLPVGWHITSRSEDNIPVIGLSGIQIEQHLTNIGMMACDGKPKPGIMTISVHKTGSVPLSCIDNRYACVILIATAEDEADIHKMAWTNSSDINEHRVVFSVLRSLLEESGGNLDEMRSGNSTMYRLMLPYGQLRDMKTDGQSIAEEIKLYVHGWNVLLAAPAGEQDILYRKLIEAGVTAHYIDNLMTALARIETEKELHAVILDRRILGSEASALARAIHKLRPASGIIVLNDAQEAIQPDAANQFMSADYATPADKVISLMIDARSIALHRKA